ncbi:MAG: A/G-specific adenine glycosylase [Planctomycetota bacterium]
MTEINVPPKLLKSAAAKQKFQHALLDWFDEHQRDLPWRRNRTPYRIWISEIMLQQTQVATVVDYYRKFVNRFPSVRKLAEADVSEVLKLWEGLGYYRRARQLHAAAQTIVEQHRGRFPTDFDDVLALPGIGRYTAGAILSISKDQRHPILEGNTIRLFARLMEMRSDVKATANQKRLWAFSESMVPQKRPGDFNQALMELGSELCRPKRPMCLLCPVNQFCVTFKKGLQAQIPTSVKKTKYETLHEAVVLIPRKNKFLVRQCGPGERWEGLWDFPRFEINPLEPDRVSQLLASSVKQLAGLAVQLESTELTIKHAVTKYRITLEVYRAIDVTGRLSKQPTPTAWKTARQIASTPMSVTGRQIADHFLESTDR